MGARPLLEKKSVLFVILVLVVFYCEYLNGVLVQTRIRIRINSIALAGREGHVVGFNWVRQGGVMSRTRDS
jgi:hypothetical protein